MRLRVLDDLRRHGLLTETLAWTDRRPALAAAMR
jgi:hypothetical protein